MPFNTKRISSGFTLVELLVVIAIIGILIAMLLPAVQMVRESGRRITCANNIRQLGLAMHTYESANEHLPYGWGGDGYTWAIPILPFIEQQNLANSLALGDSWKNGPNELAAATVIPIARCPTSPIEDHHDHNGVTDRVPSDYRVSIGSNVRGDAGPVLSGSVSPRSQDVNGLFWGCSDVRFAQVVDGLSNTVMIAESRTDPGFKKDKSSSDHWFIGSPDISAFDCQSLSGGRDFSEVVGSGMVPMNARVIDPTLHGALMEISFGSYHSGGMNVVLGDGSTHFISDDVEESLYQASFSRNGAEVNVMN